MMYIIKDNLNVAALTILLPTILAAPDIMTTQGSRPDFWDQDKLPAGLGELLVNSSAQLGTGQWLL